MDRWVPNWHEYGNDEQALVSLKINETIDAEGWCSKAVVIEGG